MSTNSKNQTANRLNDLLELLDDLHTAASEGTATEFAGMSRKELLGLLSEVVFTASEAIEEIQSHKTVKLPTLRVVGRIEKVG